MRPDLPSPLEGIRVLDLSRVLSGPYVGRIMADLGADVVKVEPPDGDMTRNWGRSQAGLRGYFVQWNAGKRGLCIDLNQPGGADLIRELACKADILVENFRPHVLDRFGLNYEALASIHPALVMVSITGFGANGPESGRGAFAPVIHAESGLIARQAEMTESQHADIDGSIADTNAALHATVSVLAALRLRDRTGEGQHIDMAMMDAQIATDDMTIYSLEDAFDTRPKRSRVWELKEGPVLIASDARRMWIDFSKEFGLVDDTPKEAGLDAKILNRRRLMSEALYELPDREAFVELMNRYNMAWGNVRRQARIEESPTLAHRGMITEVEDSRGNKRRVIRTPYKFSAAKSGVRGNAPYLGEHNVEVLKDWLALDEEAMQALNDTGVLCCATNEDGE